ncbi:MAG: membrane-associated phospholipid phosphatase [Crocinitomicaceae bacterium]|jgi:membrane-associated phospholipid phosphatase
MRIVSHIISWAFIPLLTPVYGMMLAMFVPSRQDYYFNPENLFLQGDDRKWSLLYSYFFFCAIIPGLALMYLKNRGIISTLEVDDRKERVIPILIMFASCSGLFILFQYLPENLEIPKYIHSYPLAGVIATAVFFFLTLWKKVSLHAGGVGIMTGFLIAYVSEQAEYQFWILGAAIIVSGLVMSARMYLGKHTLTEVAIGWFTGVIVTFVVNYFY